MPGEEAWTSTEHKTPLEYASLRVGAFLLCETRGPMDEARSSDMERHKNFNKEVERLLGSLKPPKPETQPSEEVTNLDEPLLLSGTFGRALCHIEIL